MAEFDVKKLRELAQALPHGDFSVWTSNSWRRIYIGDEPAITPCVQRYDNHPDLSFGEGVAAFIEAIGPQTILALCDRLEAAEKVCDAAQAVLDWTEIKHRPPKPEAIPCGEMACVRVHALVDLHAALAQRQGEGT
ncbi:hypothetical protein [Burkholderia sp. TSV86]|uniref:hypothetical protein n=1 Tax=Burkholderia sp. TSV86 TaxID=1385594 RepID=UPI0007521081|nr:hypothetical protein [Burkholderia sp. TSV86]KVE31534.1 hypothetical protein WS68_16780 [Burkholderia sp. TSV86]